MKADPAATIVMRPLSDMRPLPHLTCPVCGGPNACAPALGGDFEQRCWCEAISLSPRLVSQIGETGQKTSCICPACAAADHNALNAPDPDSPTSRPAIV